MYISGNFRVKGCAPFTVIIQMTTRYPQHIKKPQHNHLKVQNHAYRYKEQDPSIYSEEEEEGGVHQHHHTQHTQHEMSLHRCHQPQPRTVVHQHAAMNDTRNSNRAHENHLEPSSYSDRRTQKGTSRQHQHKLNAPANEEHHRDHHPHHHHHHSHLDLDPRDSHRNHSPDFDKSQHHQKGTEHPVDSNHLSDDGSSFSSDADRVDDFEHTRELETLLQNIKLQSLQNNVGLRKFSQHHHPPPSEQSSFAARSPTPTSSVATTPYKFNPDTMDSNSVITSNAVLAALRALQATIHELRTANSILEEKLNDNIHESLSQRENERRNYEEKIRDLTVRLNSANGSIQSQSQQQSAMEIAIKTQLEQSERGREKLREELRAKDRELRQLKLMVEEEKSHHQREKDEVTRDRERISQLSKDMTAEAERRIARETEFSHLQLIHSQTLEELKAVRKTCSQQNELLTESENARKDAEWSRKRAEKLIATLSEDLRRLTNEHSQHSVTAMITMQAEGRSYVYQLIQLNKDIVNSPLMNYDKLVQSGDLLQKLLRLLGGNHPTLLKDPDSSGFNNISFSKRHSVVEQKNAAPYTPKEFEEKQAFPQSARLSQRNVSKPWQTPKPLTARRSTLTAPTQASLARRSEINKISVPSKQVHTPFKYTNLSAIPNSLRNSTSKRRDSIYIWKNR